MKKYIKYIIPSIITFIILAIIYYLNNLYPFGDNPFVQIDADSQFIPVLFKIWDYLHFGGNLIYSDIGLGSSIYASLIIQSSLFSPLNLLLLLVDRNSVIYFMGILIIIKLCLITLTSFIYINRKYNSINYFYKLLFSVLYTFNGFVIFNYFNHMWLDIVILFPLLVLNLEKIFDGKSEKGYIIILSICFIITFYFSYFVVIFILMYSFVNIKTYKMTKEDKQKIIFKIGKCTLIAFLISSFSSIPLLYQICISARVTFKASIPIFYNFPMKSLYILFSPLFLIIFTLLLRKYNKNRAKVGSYIILLLLFIIPIIFDPINMQLHGGSYWCFPYRYGFITTFILMDACLFYISNYVEEQNHKIDALNIVEIIIFGILSVIGVYLNGLFRNGIINLHITGILLFLDDNITYIHILLITIIIITMFMLINAIKDKYIKYILLTFASLYSIFIFTSWTIYNNRQIYLCKNALELYNNIDLITDGRYKVEYTDYTPDYGFIFGVDGLDNWLHILPGEVMGAYKKLGYNVFDNKMFSHGGTIFSDWLLNFKNNLSFDNKLNDDMFTFIDEYKGKYLYKYNYNSNYGIAFSELPKINYENKFAFQNAIYNNLFNKNENIVEYKNYKYRNNKYLELNYDILNDGYLYFYTENFESIDYLMVDDIAIYDFGDFIKYLGNFDRNVTIKIFMKQQSDIVFDIGFISKEKIMNLKSNVIIKDNKYYINNNDNKYIFLPINNIPGIHIYNNSKEVKTFKYLGNFICVELDEGQNIIEVKYDLPFLKISIILSFFGVVLFAFYKKIISNKFLLKFTYYIYLFLIFLLFIYFYCYSFIKFL